MRYLCLAYYDEEAFEALATDEIEAMERGGHAIDESLRESGHLLAHGSLQPTQSSTSLRSMREKVTITDGPFIDAKEQVAGFFLLEARDLNDAIRLASRHAAADIGENIGWGVEIRPVSMYEAF
jgi:hypothetical protein